MKRAREDGRGDAKRRRICSEEAQMSKRDEGRRTEVSSVEKTASTSL